MSNKEPGITNIQMEQAVGSAIGVSRDREHLPTVIYGDHDAIASALAERIIEVVHEATRARGRCVLGLATGSTPIGVYRHLVQRHQRGDIDLRSVVTFNLDEYYPMAPDSFHSYHRYMHEHLFNHVNIDSRNIHIPDGTVSKHEIAEHCAAYEQAIDDAGGIDFLILGIGRSGHIGFNEPGWLLSTPSPARTPQPISSARPTSPHRP